MSAMGDQRRISGNMSLTYDPMQRQQPLLEHTSPAGPSTPFPFYERYGPEEPPAPPPAFREGFNNEYNPNYWRPEPRFLPTSWNEPDPAGWSDRGEVVREPYTPQWNNRPMRDTIPTRMFEPSENWKQSHARGRDHYSPSQPMVERYRPYSPPLPNTARSRFPHANIRPDPFRPPLYNDADHWAPDNVEPFDIASREQRAIPIPIPTTATPDRMDWRDRGRDGEERSVSPISPRGVQHSPPGFGSGIPATKRESPELPHLEALPRASGPVAPSHLVRVPANVLPPKPPSRSPSHSSNASSVNVPFAQPQMQLKTGLPPKPQFQFHQFQHRPPVPAIPPLARALANSPPLQVSSVGHVSPEADNLASTPPKEHSRHGAVVPPLHHVETQQKQPQGRSPYSSGRSNSRPSFNAPSFVPSTLAIDAPLMYPSESATPDTAEALKTSAKVAGDDAESDMDMSLPASPVKGIREEAEADAMRSSKSPRSAKAKSDSGKPSKGARESATDEEDAADASDMDMSPPGSPVLKATSSPANDPTEDLSGDKAESNRPSLAIDTSVSSPHLPHTVLRQSSSASPVPTTPEHAVEDTDGDDSDMEMSSAASETAPSLPLVARQPSVPASASSSPKPSPEEPTAAVLKPSLSRAVPAASPRPEPVLLPHTDSDILASTVVQAVVAGPPDTHVPPPAVVTSREVSVQASPQTPTTATLEQLPAEARELSPPVSEETLREETEGAERDHGANAGSHKEAPAVQQKEAAPSAGQSVTEKMTAEIPLSDALRMVAKLRFHHDPHTQDARIEPILFSNRQLADPEVAPAPPPGDPVQIAEEKEKEQLTDSTYDGTKHSLRKRFAQHQTALAEKVNRLRKEYITLHEQWMVHCAKLDDVVRANALEEAAATAGRTTRRTAAMGDAVRSDLEMEQILASLGSEELTDANHLSAKNAAVIPDMVSVTKGRVEYIYDDTNNLVEDPHEFYKLETGINDWTEEEKATFVAKYAVHPKQFGIISDFLPNKTPAQCVTFYYLHKNTTIDFRKVIAQHNTVGKRRRSGRNGKQKGNALLADILKHDDEMSRDSTPNVTARRRRRVLSASTPVPAAAASSTSTEPVEQPKKANAPLSRRSTTQNTPTPTPTPDPEPAPKRPRRRANPSAKAAAAMGQEPVDDAVPDEEVRPAKRLRRSRKSKAEAEVGTSATIDETPANPTETKLVDQSDVNARKKAIANGSSWSDDDKALFLKLLAQHGDDFKRIAASMPNKTTIQVAAFYRSNLTEMELAKVAALAPKRSPTPQPTYEDEPQPMADFEVATPISKASTPVVESAPGPVSRARSGGRMSPPHPEAASSTEADQQEAVTSRDSVPPSPEAGESVTQQVRLPDTDTVRAPYHGGIGSAFASTSRANPTPLTNSFGAHPPPTVTMTFPSAVAYSALSPSSYIDRQMMARAALAFPNSPPFEFSDFAPQPWQTASLTRRIHGQAPSAVSRQGPPSDLPTALETTEDLVRYLEHRTRLTAGQNGGSGSDFM